MKKILSSILLLSLSVFTFTSCNDDDPNYVPKPVNVSTGVFVINAGSYQSIPGTVTLYDYTTQTSTQDVFASVNCRVLGGTPNDAVVYGSKMYIAVNEENTVEVVDKNTMRSLGTVHTANNDAMGTDKGKQPRHVISYNGSVYVSTYDGYVGVIDTTSYKVTNVYQAGSYPEGMAVLNGKLYVANCSYGNGTNPSVSEIDLSTGTTTNITDEAITNPVAITVIDGALYILDSGLYDASWNQVGAGVRKLSGNVVTKVADATMMAAYGSKLYLVNSPYGASSVSYSVYDTTTGSSTPLALSDITSPVAIGVDPVTGDILVGSYSLNPDTGYPSYNTNGYVNIYKNDGTFVKTFEAGLNMTTFVFNTGVIYE